MAEDFEAEDAEYEEYTFTPSVITENGREVIDYTGVESDRVLLSNRRDILSLPRPSWMPELDGAGLAADHYLPVTVHDDEGNYYLQSRIRTGEEEKTVTNYGISRTVIEPVYETKIYKLKLDVLVATVDYYIKHERAVLTSKAATPEVAKALCREVGIPRAAHTMSWQRYLDSVALLGFCRNYRESEDPLVKMATERPAKKGRDRTAVGKKQTYLVFTEQHGPLLQAFRDKKLDLNLQKQEYIDTHAKGEDTSYGNVNCWNTFRDEYGILIKKQNGKDFTRKADLEAIRTAVSDVWSYYGNLTAEAGKYNLVLSYADNCKQHARKSAVGLFHPLYHAIGVSFFKDISDPEHSRMSPSEILVHETTHWLDSLKGRETHNWYASDVSGTLENRIAALYKNELRSYVKSPRNKDKKKLGDYWYRTCECLARAVEQDFALSHGISFDEPGYLPEDIYKERVQPLVKELLEENRRHFNLTMPEKAAEIGEKKENLMEYTLTDTLKERLEKEADNIYFYNVKDIVNEKNRKGFEADVKIPAETIAMCGARDIGDVIYHVSRKGPGITLSASEPEKLKASGINEDAIKIVLDGISTNARSLELDELKRIDGFSYKNQFGKISRVLPAKEQLEENIRYIAGGYYNAMTDDPDNNKPLSFDDLFGMCVPDIYDMVASGGNADYADGICRHLRFLGNDFIKDTVLRIGQEEQVLVAESQSLTKETRIKDWYEKTYPDDAAIVSSISPEATFADLEKAVIEDRYNWNPRYDAGDSTVREQFFKALSAINDEPYEVIYKKLQENTKGLHAPRFGMNWDGTTYRLPGPEEQLRLNAVEILSMLQNNYQPGSINGTVTGEPRLTVEKARDYALEQVYDIYADGQGGLTQKDGISSYLRALSPYKTLEIIDEAILKTCTTPSYLLDGEKERILDINAMLKDESLIRIHDHNETTFWSDRTMASSFYSSAMIACDGSEAEQYRKVFADLAEGKPLCLGEDIPYDKYPDYRARLSLVTDVCSCDGNFELQKVSYREFLKDPERERFIEESVPYVRWERNEEKNDGSYYMEAGSSLAEYREEVRYGKSVFILTQDGRISGEYDSVSSLNEAVIMNNEQYFLDILSEKSINDAEAITMSDPLTDKMREVYVMLNMTEQQRKDYLHQNNLEHIESFVFDRLSAAGIEVITVKDEFDRILAEENIVQKMAVNGDTYGFVHNGKIYLNPELMNSNVAVHKYTHLWDAYTQKTNPELWNKGLNLFKDTKYWNEVISDPNYQDIKDDENLVLSEIHSRICGDIAKKVLERIAELDDEQVKLDAIDWDKETWAYIATDIGFHTFDNVDPDLKIKTSELRDFLSTPMKDLMAGKQITKALHEHNPELSENGTFVLDGASNGMLSKYTGRTDISELEDFRNYASSRITGTAGDKSYFAQLYLLGQEWCKEKGLPLPELDELVLEEIKTYRNSIFAENTGNLLRQYNETLSYLAGVKEKLSLNPDNPSAAADHVTLSNGLNEIDSSIFYAVKAKLKELGLTDFDLCAPETGISPFGDNNLRFGLLNINERPLHHDYGVISIDFENTDCSISFTDTAGEVFNLSVASDIEKINGYLSRRLAKGVYRDTEINEETVYRYYMKRPVDLGSCPKGFIGFENLDSYVTHDEGWNYIATVDYDRPLSEKEIADFEIHVPKPLRERVYKESVNRRISEYISDPSLYSDEGKSAEFSSFIFREAQKRAVADWCELKEVENRGTVLTLPDFSDEKLFDKFRSFWHDDEDINKYEREDKVFSFQREILKENNLEIKDGGSIVPLNQVIQEQAEEPEPALSDSPAPVSITAFSKALSETSPLPPSEPAVFQEESRPSVQSVPGTDAAGLPFNLYFNEEKGRYNIKFDPENNGDFFGDIVGELKANGWKYAPSFKNWFPLKVEGSEEFAKSLLEKYSTRIQASLDKLQEASAALGAALKEPSGPSDPVSEAVCLIPLDSAPASLKYFDRNHNESNEFMTYFNGHLSAFGPLAADISEADASRILKALGHISKATLDEREERLALDSDNNPVIVSRTKDGTKYTQANLPGLIDFAVRLSEKTVSDTKAYLDQYDPAKIVCGDMFRDIYADLYYENRLILNDIRDIASRYLSEDSLGYEAVQKAKKAELERKQEPYLVVEYSEKSEGEFIPAGTVYTLNEAERILPELDARFKNGIKTDLLLQLPMPGKDGVFRHESGISCNFNWCLGTGHPVSSLNDFVRMNFSNDVTRNAYEENWKRVNVPGISDKRVSEIDGVLDELATSVRSSLDSKLSSLGSALSEAKAVGDQVIGDVNDYERAKKEVMKCKKEINDCYVKAALSAVRRLESSPIGYRTDGDENIHKYVNHAIRNFISDLKYSESRKDDNPSFDWDLWNESLSLVEDVTDEKLDAYLLSAEEWFKPAPDAAVAFKERFEAEVRNDDCTRDGLYRISKKILGSFSKEQKSEISTWLSQEPFMSNGLVKTLASWLPDDLLDSFIRNEVKRPVGSEKIIPKKNRKRVPDPEVLHSR